MKDCKYFNEDQINFVKEEVKFNNFSVFLWIKNFQKML